MKAVFDRQALLGAIVPAAGISQTKNTFAAVDGLLFECPPDPKYGNYDTDKDNLCRISAFDLEKGLRTSVECTVLERGMAVINTVKILQIVRALPDGEITIEVNQRGLAVITGGSFRFEITASPGNDFPAMPMFVGDRVYRIPQTVLKNVIAKTLYAVAQNDPRAAFNGALFRIRDGRLSVVGSDGFRIAIAETGLEEGNGLPEGEIIIPGKFLGELLRLLNDSEEEITMMLTRKHVVFQLDRIYFFTRIMDTEYVPYEQFLPSAAKTEAVVSREDFLSAMESASVVTEDKPGGTKSIVRLVFSETGIALSSVSSGGSVSGTVPAKVDGEEITIAFQCRMLAEALKATPESCRDLRIQLNSPKMGVTVAPAEQSGTKLLHFVLPWLLNNG